MALFPGHNYLGPGNDINNGQPIDFDDQIAKVHDTAYVNASDYSAIQSADIEAFKSFGKDALTNLNYHSAIGALGLGPKIVQQALTGT